MSDQEYREVKCACGAVTAVVPPGMEFAVRCWTCPKDEPQRPTLRLVKS